MTMCFVIIIRLRRPEIWKYCSHVGFYIFGHMQGRHPKQTHIYRPSGGTMRNFSIVLIRSVGTTYVSKNSIISVIFITISFLRRIRIITNIIEMNIGSSILKQFEFNLKSIGSCNVMTI